MTTQLDAAAVRADEDLVEDLRVGRTCDRNELERALTEYRDFAIGGQR